MAQNLLSVINDGSNESGISKMNPVCIFIFDCEGSNQVEFKFYSTYWNTSENFWISETLFDKIQSTLIFDELDWDYVVAMALNNTNTNIGDKKSLKYCTLAKNVEVFIHCRM